LVGKVFPNFPLTTKAEQFYSRFLFCQPLTELLVARWGVSLFGFFKINKQAKQRKINSSLPT
jgi:hypothetical protein